MELFIVPCMGIVIVACLFCWTGLKEKKFERTFRTTPYAAREEVRQQVRETLLTLKKDGKEKEFSRARATAASFCFIELL